MNKNKIMLYIIRTFGRNKNKTALKVGFSDNLKERFQTYRTENPFFEIISTRCGTRIDEEKLHLYLTAKGYKQNFLNEWFLDDPKVISLFHTKISTINKTIWINRDNLFSKSDFKNKLKMSIYEELRLTHTIKHPKEIDLDWKLDFNRKVLLNIKKKTDIVD